MGFTAVALETGFTESDSVERFVAAAGQLHSACRQSANYPKGDSRNMTFPRPGIVFVNCHLHPNMAGIVVVTPNAWNARADPAGKFEFRDVPPGEYDLVAWHRTAGYFRKKLRVIPGGVALHAAAIRRFQHQGRPLSGHDPPAVGITIGAFWG
jgi:hypothetical protein